MRAALGSTRAVMDGSRGLASAGRRGVSSVSRNISRGAPIGGGRIGRSARHGERPNVHSEHHQHHHPTSEAP